MNSNQDIALVKNNEEDDVIFIEDEKTYPDPSFEVKRFTINKDVYFDIEIAYLEGHPIVKTKTLKLYYHSDKPEDMSAGGTLARKFMRHGIREKFAVNLLNYLCRLINGFNLFHCYVHDEIKTFKEELKAFMLHEYEDLQEVKNMSLNIVARTGHNAQTGKFSFLEGLLDNGNHIKEKLLNDYRDKRVPEVIPNLKHLQFIPIWSYVNPTLAKSKSAVHICHLAFILERLVHNENYPEFNNSAALALLNVAQESNEVNLSVETIIENSYNHAIERKRFYKKALIDEKDAHAKTQMKLDQVIEQNQTLIKTVVEQTTEIKELKDMNKELRDMNIIQLDNIDTLMDLTTNINGKLDDTKRDLHYKDKTLELINKGIGWVEHEIGKMPMRSTITDANVDVLILYRSTFKPVDKGKMPIPIDGQIWIATYVGDIENFKAPNIPEDAEEIYRVQANRLNSYKKLVDDEHLQPFILEVYSRCFLIDEERLDDFINSIDLVLNEDGQFKSVRNLEHIHHDIAQRKIEKERKREDEAYLEFKRKVMREHKFPSIVLQYRSRLLYLKQVNDQGNEDLVPIFKVEIGEAIKQSWWFRSGAGGNHKEEIARSMILNGRFAPRPDPRNKYEIGLIEE